MPAVKHGGARIMIWDHISFNGTGSLPMWVEGCEMIAKKL